MVFLYIVLVAIWLFPLLNCIMILWDVTKETKEIDVFPYSLLILLSAIPLFGFISIIELDCWVDEVYNSTFVNGCSIEKRKYWKKYSNLCGIHPFFYRPKFFKIKIKI